MRNVHNHLRAAWRKEDGASLLEFAVVISLFLLLFFALLDFGRLGFNWVMTEKAMQRAARIAAVRPPVCDDVPIVHEKKSGSDERYGTACKVNDTCVTPEGGGQICVLGTAAIDCAADNGGLTPGQVTAKEIWCTLEPILPSNATPQNIKLAYMFDPNLGFVGGPYTPMVEVAVATDSSNGATPLCFEFVTPISGLARLVGGSALSDECNTDSGLGSLAFPDLSVSLPGEDLAQGMDG